MGYDHAEKREVAIPSSSSGSSDEIKDEIFAENHNVLDRRGTAETARTTSDDDEPASANGANTVKLERTHTAHHLGKLTLRAVDDEEPAYALSRPLMCPC